MRIIEYSCKDSRDNWSFDKISFNGLNLLVGASATGKTRLLNTISNLALFITGARKSAATVWSIIFEAEGCRYQWDLATDDKTDIAGKVIKEKLIRTAGGKRKVIIDRTSEKFVFDGKELPKLSATESGVFLLKEESLIKPVFNEFQFILRRNFWSDELKSLENYHMSDQKIEKGLDQEDTLEKLFKMKVGLSYQLWLLKKFLPEKFIRITEYFKNVFPSIEAVSFEDLTKLLPNIAALKEIPAFCIKEAGNNKLIPLHELSSGMQKVLMVITDLLTLPKGAIYMLDEYENSLGINAIDFLPELLNENDLENQIFITSHHPYLINKIPVENWIVFHRKAAKVSVMQGKELARKFEKSRQQAFLQLINEPFYKEGIE